MDVNVLVAVEKELQSRRSSEAQRNQNNGSVANEQLESPSAPSPLSPHGRCNERPTMRRDKRREKIRKPTTVVPDSSGSQQAPNTNQR
jgi:hypothetical protein